MSLHENLTDDERRQLRQFVRLVAEMKNSRFFQTAMKQDHQISWRMTDDGGELKLPDYDSEDFRSFLTTFRQVAISESESVYLTHVLNTVGKYGNDEIRAELKKIREDRIYLLEGKKSQLRIGDGTREYTPKQLLGILVNGIVFHVSPDLDEEARFWETQDMGTYVGYIWGAVILPIFRLCMGVVSLLKREGYLEEHEFKIWDGKRPGTL